MRELTLADPRRSADREANLVEALRRQETGAIEALIALYGDRAYRLAMRITGNRPDAEEVVQDAFWTVVRRIETFRGDAAFGSWLYRITANCAYTKLRVRRARHQESWMDKGSVMVDGHAPEFQDWSARIEDPALQFELRNVLIAALDSLPEDYRAIVALRDVEGLSPQDVSQITGLSVAAVKTRTHRARLVLRKPLGEYLSDRPLSLSPPSPRRGDGRAGRRGPSRGPGAVSLPGPESRRCDRVRHRAARPGAEADRRSVSEPAARVHA
jgi:RNA polymerase sigma-70 factor, ECF subfamily